MNRNLLILLGIGATALYFYAKAKIRSGTNLIVKPVDIAIDLKNSSLITGLLALKLKLNLINNEAASVVLKNLNLNILVNDSEVARILKTEPFTVKGNSNEIITIGTEINLLNILTQNNLKDLITGKLPIELKVVGTIDTDLGKLGIAYKKILSL